jgi:hypothetical protein
LLHLSVNRAGVAVWAVGFAATFNAKGGTFLNRVWGWGWSKWKHLLLLQNFPFGLWSANYGNIGDTLIADFLYSEKVLSL